MTAKSISGRAAGSISATSASIFTLCGFSAMPSYSVKLMASAFASALRKVSMLMPSYRVSTPHSCKSSSARPPLVASAGMPITAPSGTLAISSDLPAYTPSGS